MRSTGKENRGSLTKVKIKVQKTHTSAHTHYTKHVLVHSQELSGITYQKLELDV